MRSFCLAHGSTQSPAGWDRLVPELERRGHSCFLVDLPTDEPQAPALRYAEVIAQTLDTSGANPADTVVVAHSASGLFLPLVAELRTVCRLVYLAALVPEVGRSVMEQFQGNPSMFNPEWVGQDPREPAVAEHFLFHDCSPEVLTWALSTVRLLYAERAMTEPFPGAHLPAVPNTYILCEEDRTLTPDWSRRVARERLGVEPVELAGGHCPHVSRPAALAEVLSRVASEPAL